MLPERYNVINVIIIYMKKFLHSDWLRAVQFLVNTVPKKEIQWQKNKFSANFFRFKILKFSYDSCIFIACVCFSDLSLCYNYAVDTLWNKNG